MQNNRSLLLVIVILLLGILGVLVYQSAQDSPAENLQEGLNEVAEDVSDRIQQQ